MERKLLLLFIYEKIYGLWKFFNDMDDIMVKTIIYIGANINTQKKLKKIVKEISSEKESDINFIAISEYESFIKIMKEGNVCVPIFDYLGFDKYQDILTIVIKKQELFPYMLVIYKNKRIKVREISFSRFYILFDEAPNMLWKNEIKKVFTIIDSVELLHSKTSELDISHKILIDKDKTIFYMKKDIESLKLEISNNLQGIYEFFIKLIEMNNYLLYSHTIEVVRISKFIANQLGLNQKEIDEIEYSAYLHDLGKLALPPEITTTPINDLDEYEKILYKQHPSMAVYMLGSIQSNESSENILNFIKYHHENYNGTGFPEKLKGREIPLGARVIHIADFFSNEYRIHNELDADGIFSQMKKYYYQHFDENLFNILYSYVITLQKSKQEERILIKLHQLKVGMITATDTFTQNGLMLIKKDTKLNDQLIIKITKYSQFDPIIPGIYIKK